MKVLINARFMRSEILYKEIIIFDCEISPVLGVPLYCLVVKDPIRRHDRQFLRYGTSAQLLSFWNGYRFRLRMAKKDREEIEKLLRGLQK